MEFESGISRGSGKSVVVYSNYLNLDDWRIDDILRYRTMVNEDGSVTDEFIGNVSLAEHDKSYFWWLRRLAKLLYEEETT